MPASVPNDFTAGTLIVSDDMDANFAALVAYINSNSILKDASVAFTNVPSGPSTDPTTANQLVRKAFLDKRQGYVLAESSGNQAHDAAATLDTITSLSSTLNSPSGLFTVSGTGIEILVNMVAEVECYFRWAADATGVRRGALRHNSTNRVENTFTELSPGSQYTFQGQIMRSFTAGDTVTIQSTQNSGGSLAFEAAIWVKVITLL